MIPSGISSWPEERRHALPKAPPDLIPSIQPSLAIAPSAGDAPSSREFLRGVSGSGDWSFFGDGSAHLAVFSSPRHSGAAYFSEISFPWYSTAMLTFAYLIEPPFNYRDASGSVTGCDVELARAVLAMAGRREVDFVEAEFAQLLPGLGQGHWRMTTGLFVTAERRRIAAFSRPIWALSDGLLVAKGNPLALKGYRSAAGSEACILAVIRDQVQHGTAVSFGVPDDRLLICDTYEEAAEAVLTGRASAYASVARAHAGFIEQAGQLSLDVVPVGADEKEPAFGCFGFSLADDALRRVVDDALTSYLGSVEHRSMMRSFGFTDQEINPIVRPTFGTAAGPR